MNSQDDLRSAIGNIESLLGMNQFALVDEDNVVYTQYTTYTGGSRHAFLSEENFSGRLISIVSLYGSSRQLCLAIPTPDLTIMGKKYKACFVQFDINDIVELLALDDKGRTHFAFYSANGSNLSGTGLGPVIAKHNFFDAIRGIVPEDVLNENIARFENAEEGTLSFEYKDSRETLCYSPIEGTDWKMAVLIRESLIQDQIRDISEKNIATSRRQIIYTFASVLLLAVILLYQFGILSKERIEKEKETSRTFQNLANTDSMTGVGNKYAYSEKEAVINSRIKDGGEDKLAVVVGDINGLKYVNDTQGHAAGDKLIRDAAALIRERFEQGEVFRIGGDEFAILLQGEGVENLDEVLAGLNREIEENVRKNAVVIAFGYSTLKKEDRQLSDVFGRADEMMYERKKELKEMGALTRC